MNPASEGPTPNVPDGSWKYLLPKSEPDAALNEKNEEELACRYELDRLTAQGLIARGPGAASWLAESLPPRIWNVILGAELYPASSYLDLTECARVRILLLLNGDHPTLMKEENLEYIMSIYYDWTSLESGASEHRLKGSSGGIYPGMWPNYFQAVPPPWDLCRDIPHSWAEVPAGQKNECLRKIGDDPEVFAEIVQCLRFNILPSSKSILRIDVIDVLNGGFLRKAGDYSPELRMYFPAQHHIADILITVDLTQPDSKLFSELERAIRLLRGKREPKIPSSSGAKKPGPREILKWIALLRLERSFGSRPDAVEGGVTAICNHLMRGKTTVTSSDKEEGGKRTKYIRTPSNWTRASSNLTALQGQNVKRLQALHDLPQTLRHQPRSDAKEDEATRLARAYSVLEEQLKLSPGTLAKELPEFAQQLLLRSDTSALNRVNAIAALHLAGQGAQAQIHYPQAMEHYRAATLTSKDRDILEWLRLQNAVGWLYHLQGRHPKGLAHCQEIWQTVQQAGKDEDPEGLIAHRLYARALEDNGKHAEAEAEYQALSKIQERVAARPVSRKKRQSPACAL